MCIVTKTILLKLKVGFVLYKSWVSQAYVNYQLKVVSLDQCFITKYRPTELPLQVSSVNMSIRLFLKVDLLTYDWPSSCRLVMFKCVISIVIENCCVPQVCRLACE